MHQLEAALAAAAPQREQAWAREVRQALGVLGAAAAEEARNAAQPDSLLSDIARTQPRLRNRARGLKIHYRQLQDGIAALDDELGAAAGQAVDFTDIRQRLTWVLAGLRHQRARESDLIYEAYYEAFRSDIPTTPPASSPAGNHRRPRLRRMLSVYSAWPKRPGRRYRLALWWAECQH